MKIKEKLILLEAQHGDTLQNVEILKKALEESVILQSHYAMLLNEYDGGQRKQFKDADEWITRLLEIRKI